MISALPLRRIGWLAMTVSALGVALASTRYFSLDPATFIPPQVPVYLTHLGPLLLHIGGGVVALAIGPWQLWGRFRSEHLKLHRAMGRVYLVAVLALSAGALLIAPLSIGGPMAHLGFDAMAAAVLLCTGVALIAILRGDVATHRRWMTRSYAVIFTAVTFRIWLGLLAACGLPFDVGYAVGSWVSWALNLMVAEALLGVQARRRLPRPARAAR